MSIEDDDITFECRISPGSADLCYLRCCAYLYPLGSTSFQCRFTGIPFALRAASCTVTG